MLRYYDIHAHLADPRIAAFLPDILRRSRDRGLAGVLANAARLAEWPAIVDLARQPGVFGALGLHPFFLGDWQPALPEQLRTVLRQDRAGGASAARLRAIGEIGLDFTPEWCPSPEHRRRQIEIFEAQLGLAAEFALPVILHNRKSWDDFLAVWRNWRDRGLSGVCHHFTGSRDVARRLLDLGLYLSFCGPLTYPHSRRMREAAVYVPLERILTETDTPDLPAEPFRGQQSEPWHVCEVVCEIARLKQLPEADVADQIEANFSRALRLSLAGQTR
jgi:TatD DNase family protein